MLGIPWALEFMLISHQFSVIGVLAEVHQRRRRLCFRCYQLDEYDGCLQSHYWLLKFESWKRRLVGSFIQLKEVGPHMEFARVG